MGPGPGHNLGTITHPDALPELLLEQHGRLLERRDELLAGAERVPTVDSDEAAGKVGDFLKQLDGCRKNADATRVGEKEPYLSGGRAVDGFFKRIIEPLDKARKPVKANLDKFLIAKREAEARERAEAERKAREEATRLADAAKTDADLDRAIAAESAQREAAKHADVNAAELSRTRGDHGAVASLRTSWASEVLDIHAVDMRQIQRYLPIAAVEQAIRAAVRDGVRELAGVRIYEKHDTVVR
jgi:hypothetical protein